MATQNLAASPASPTPPTSSGSEDHIEIVCTSRPSRLRKMAVADPAQVSLDVSAIEEIIDYIVSSRQRDSDPFVSFHWQPSQVRDLFDELDARMVELGGCRIRRFEYDYESKTVYLDVGYGSAMHAEVQFDLSDQLRSRVAQFCIDTGDSTIRHLAQSNIFFKHTTLMEYEGKSVQASRCLIWASGSYSALSSCGGLCG